MEHSANVLKWAAPATHGKKVGIAGSTWGGRRRCAQWMTVRPKHKAEGSAENTAESLARLRAVLPKQERAVYAQNMEQEANVLKRVAQATFR